MRWKPSGRGWMEAGADHAIKAWYRPLLHGHDPMGRSHGNLHPTARIYWRAGLPLARRPDAIVVELGKLTLFEKTRS
jgi:hypothetical protein